MRILGIDPGYARVGWGVVEIQSSEFKIKNCGCFETVKSERHEDRLLAVYKNVNGLFRKYKPDALSVESLFFNTNAKTALMVGEARGVILLAGAMNKIPVAVYTPLQVKIAVSGYGRADKFQVGQMIKTILHLKTLPKPDDTVDALAVALTHAFTKKFK